MLKRAKKGQNIWKFGQKCTEFENILKKSRWLHAIITHNKLLKKALADFTFAVNARIVLHHFIKEFISFHYSHWDWKKYFFVSIVWCAQFCFFHLSSDVWKTTFLIYILWSIIICFTYRLSNFISFLWSYRIMVVCFLHHLNNFISFTVKLL